MFLVSAGAVQAAGPIAQNDSNIIAEGASIQVIAPGVLVNDSDPEGGPLTVTTTPVTNPTHGTVVLSSNGAYTYTHDGSETDSDSFVYEVCDNELLCATATVSITVLEGAPATNVTPARARAHIDARLLPGDRCDDFEARIRERIADPAIEIERLLGYAALSSPVKTPLYAAISRVAAASESGAVVVPRVSAGSSDAHWLRAQGVVVYGFVPRWLEADAARGIHGPDERISIRNLERGARALVDLIEAFDELER